MIIFLTYGECVYLIVTKRIFDYLNLLFYTKPTTKYVSIRRQRYVLFQIILVFFCPKLKIGLTYYVTINIITV